MVKLPRFLACYAIIVWFLLTVLFHSFSFKQVLKLLPGSMEKALLSTISSISRVLQLYWQLGRWVTLEEMEDHHQ